MSILKNSNFFSQKDEIAKLLIKIEYYLNKVPHEFREDLHIPYDISIQYKNEVELWYSGNKLLFKCLDLIEIDCLPVLDNFLGCLIRDFNF